MTTHRTGRRRLAAALAAALAFGTLGATLAAPAFADDIIEDTGGDRGWGRAPEQDPKGTYKCDDEGNMWFYNPASGWHLWFLGVDLKCKEPKETTNSDFTGTVHFCETNLQVFRFYGTALDPTKGWTTSMINSDRWCKSRPNELAVWPTSGYDKITPNVTRNNHDQREIGGNIPDVAAEPDRVLGRGLNIHPMYGSSWEVPHTSTLTGSRPFAGNDGCVGAQTNNPIAENLGPNSEFTRAQKDDLRAQLVDIFNAVQDTHTKRLTGVVAAPAKAGAVYAQKITGLQEATAVRQADGTIKYTVKFDNDACANPMRYVSTYAGNNPSTDAEKRAYTVTGTCYIPVQRMAEIYRNAAGQKVYRFPDIYQYGGFRYSKLYKGEPYSAAEPRGAGGSTATKAEKQILAAWREKMGDWYKNNSVPDKTGSLRRGLHQVIPADPYKLKYGANGQVTNVTENRQRRNYFDRPAAITALSDYSKCYIGSRVSWSEGAGGPVNVPAPEVTLDVDVPKVQQAGGFSRVQGFSVSGGFASPSTAVSMDTMTYSLTLQLPASMTLDTEAAPGIDAQVLKPVVSGATATACRVSDDGRSCTIDVVATSASHDVDVQVAYHRPTNPGELVNVRVSNVKATYNATTSTSSATFTFADPTVTSGTCTSGGKVQQCGTEAAPSGKWTSTYGGATTKKDVPSVGVTDSRGRSVTVPAGGSTEWTMQVIGATGTGN